MEGPDPHFVQGIEIVEEELQNRNAGDIGDFGKYGLLRSLARGTELSLGVCWYLHPDEDQRNDGGHTQYLQQTRDNRIRFRALDPEGRRLTFGAGNEKEDMTQRYAKRTTITVEQRKPEIERIFRRYDAGFKCSASTVLQMLQRNRVG